MGEGEVGGVSRDQFLRTMVKKFNCMLIKLLCSLPFSPVDPLYPPGSPSQSLSWVLFPISRYWNLVSQSLGLFSDAHVLMISPVLTCSCDVIGSILMIHVYIPSLDLSLSSDSYTQPSHSLLKCVTSKSELLVSPFNCTPQPVFPFLSNDIATDPVASTPNPKHP